MNKKIKAQNGITLISLIIVIIVLIILSFVTVEVVLHHNFIGTAEGAVNNANNKIEESQNSTSEAMNEWNRLLSQ